MKLIKKSGILFLGFSSVLLLFAGIMIYAFIIRMIHEETREKLTSNVDRIYQKIESGTPVSSVEPVLDIENLQTFFGPELVEIKDTLLFDPVEGEKELFLEIRSIREIKGIWYEVTVRQVILEHWDYIGNIGLGLLTGFFVLILMLYLGNQRISKSILSTFHDNLELMRKFDVSKLERLELKQSNIDEFRSLNDTLTSFSEKIIKDYRQLKEFTENASHEMQTPLSIILLKLDELLQNTELPVESKKAIISCKQAASRLSKLSKSLLFLAKIENQQFIDIKEINVTELMEYHLGQFQDFIEDKEIELSKKLQTDVKLNVNQTLLESVMLNLLGNAITYNLIKGKLIVDLSEGSLCISNSGAAPEHEQKIFDRFKKGKSNSEGNGLGLTIVNKICEHYSWTLTYTYEKDLHQMRIDF